jgi:GNAT superfamily N-acetyltransferase
MYAELRMRTHLNERPSPQQTIWVRYSWDLDSVRLTTTPPAGYEFNGAIASRFDEVVSVVLAAYASDPIWGKIIDHIETRMTQRISSTFGRIGCEYLVALFGDSIVAVSGIAVTHSTDQNLLTGICTLPTHQRKGLGRHLLGLSLLRLHEMGLDRAQVYTERGSVADRKLYPLFGSYREENVRYPGAESPLQPATVPR